MDTNGKDDLKTQFATREGVYRLMTLSEYSRPNRVGYQNNQSNPQVRVSLVTLPVAPVSAASPTTTTTMSAAAAGGGGGVAAGPPHRSTASSAASSLTLNQEAAHRNATQPDETGADAADSVLANGGGLLPHRTGHVGGMSDDALDGAPMHEHGQHHHHQQMQHAHHMQHHQQHPNYHITNSQYASSPGSAGSSGGLMLSNGGAALNNGMGPSTAALNGGDRIVFNYGKELFVYAYRGCKKQLTVDMSKPLDKKLYKGTNPSCHDFNATAAQSDGAPMLVGFTTGQIQLVQTSAVGKRDQPNGRLFNEERFVDKSKVTCLKWVPGSLKHFLAAHASGHVYLYADDLPCSPASPAYQPLRLGDGFAVHASKSKQPRNPVHRWTFGGPATPNAGVNEMAFSPCGQMLAIVSQDGFLRVFRYDRQELLGVARSYFGGFLCVCWSPDGKYIVVGGEDDLVTVWSVAERRVVARGQGHRSWVSVVAFDPYTSYTASWDGPDFSDDENPANDGVGAYRCFTGSAGGGGGGGPPTAGGSDGPPEAAEQLLRDERPDRAHRKSRPMSSSSTIPDKLGTSYRLGSVSQDTQLCLWDITEDVLRQSHEIRQRLGSHDAPPMMASGVCNGVGGVVATAPPQNDSAIGTATSSSLSYDSSSKATPAHHHHHNAPHPGGADPGGQSASGINAFNSITQRLSNFRFGSDGKRSTTAACSTSADAAHGKKAFTFSKSAGASHQAHFGTTPTTAAASASPPVVSPTFRSSAVAASASAASRCSSGACCDAPVGPGASGTSLVSSYDPMRLIGTAVCPRFDECPLLEPLVCKKIAHERLTALIFREDCFLTACQDGLIYTWARPGFANMSQHMVATSTATSPNAAPTGGTVV